MNDKKTSKMNSSYISRALSFHGQPMQKIWEDERGTGNLQNCGVTNQIDYSIYQERQRYFTFQDRAKRLKLHQFFARKATDLYDAELTTNKVEVEKIAENVQYIAPLPPYELFVNKNKDKQKSCRCVLEAIKPGDIVYCMVTKININMVKPLCMEEPMARYLSDMQIKAYLTKAGKDKDGKPRVINKNDVVRCEVIETSIDAERLYLSLESTNEKNKDRLGVVSYAELPKYYRLVDVHKSDKFEEYMFKSKEFLNPNYDILYEINGLDVNETYSFMSSLKSNFPRDEYAKELRRTQASKWAFRSVAEGIEYFKNGNHVEAFQCLNKALAIDPRNVEGLVARGALYANKGSFLKAVEDFETALKLNTYHANARKYMGETLVALGRRYEDEHRMKEAAKAYQDCLNIIPNHEQARLSLEAIKQRMNVNVPFYETASAAVAAAAIAPPPAAVITMPLPIVPAVHIKQEIIEPEEDVIAVKESSSDEGSSTSGSSSESDHSDHEENGKEGSLSPLSKRMALHVASLQKEEQSRKQLNQPFYMTAYNVPPAPPVATAKQNMTDFKLDDDDTGSRVRKLLQDASKHKKQKRKSKKKKSKKSRKVSRKEKSGATTLLDGINFQEAYKAISSMNIENKLTENLQKYEKTIAQIKKRQNELVQSIEAGMTTTERKRSDSPPPRAPSMRLPNNNNKVTTNNYAPSSSTSSSRIYSNYPSTSSAAASTSAGASSAAGTSNDQAKLSFQIKRATKVDLMGLVRIATPLVQRSPSPRRSRSRSRSRSRGRRRRSRSRSRTRSRSRSPAGRWNRRRYRTRSRSVSVTRAVRRRRSRSRRSSRSRSPYRRTRSRSRSRSRPGRSRRASPPRRGAGVGRGIGRDRRPSPQPRRRSITPPSRSRGGKKRGGVGGGGRGGAPVARGSTFGNRVWRREDGAPAPAGRDVNGRWLHDKFDAAAGMPPNKPDDGPSIEEIDEIINRAQQQRKQEIIQRDKDILKKPMGGQF